MPNYKKFNKTAYCKRMKLLTNTDGTIKKCVQNIVRLLRNDPVLMDKIRLNDLDGRIHISADVPWLIPSNRIDADGTAFFSDFDEARLRVYIDEHIGWCNDNMLSTAFKAVAADNSYNPRIEYFEELVWDSVPRLETLFIDYLGAPDDTYTRTVTKLVFTAAVARTYHPGIKFDIGPVLTGPQGIGKSLLSQIMSVRPEWYANDISVIDRNTHEKIIGKLIVDLSELSAMNRHPEELKDFVSSTVDVLRRAYGRNVETYPRSCIFIASSDKDQYLNDTAGDRRWFPIKCSTRKKKDASTLTSKEVDRIWAEAVKYYKDGTSLEFPETLKEDAAKIRSEYSEVEEELGQIKDYIAGKRSDRICSEELLENCLHMPINPANKRRVNSILKNTLELEPAILDFGKYGHHLRGFRI